MAHNNDVRGMPKRVVPNMTHLDVKHIPTRLPSPSTPMPVDAAVTKQQSNKSAELASQPLPSYTTPRGIQRRDTMDDAPPPMLPSDVKAAEFQKQLAQNAKVIADLMSRAGGRHAVPLLPSGVVAPRTPDVRKTSATADVLKFTYRLPDPQQINDESIANGLRIHMETTVPTFAIDRTVVEINTTTMMDNRIHDRLCLLPLWSASVDKHPYPTDCDCGLNGCAKCELPITLHIKPDPDVQIRHVTTLDLVMPPNSDLIPVDVLRWRQFHPSSASSFVVKKSGVLGAQPSMNLHQWTKPGLLFKLGRNQELKLTAYVRKGNGAMHAKWRPAYVDAYNFAADIKLDNVLASNVLTGIQRQAFVDSCPMHIFKVKTPTASGKETIVIEDAHKCTHCLRCMQKAESFGRPQLVTVAQKQPLEFMFTVQSKGGMPPAEIVSRGFSQMRAQVDEQQVAVQQWAIANPQFVPTSASVPASLPTDAKNASAARLSTMPTSSTDRLSSTKASNVATAPKRRARPVVAVESPETSSASDDG